MSRGVVKITVLLVTISLFAQITATSPVYSAPEGYTEVKELNLVYLHGMGGDCCVFQLLSDHIMEQLAPFAAIYEQSNPDTTIQVNTLARCYPGYAGIDDWANNIADSIDKHFQGKDNLILIGHSMGGKAALYAVAQNIGNLSDRVVAVVTINSPIKSLEQYRPPGGELVLDYCRTVLLGSDEGVCSSVIHWDSSQDGDWVSSNKHWLAFISSERYPLSHQFDRVGVDVWPRDMDDGVIPISAQYSDNADVIYYGEHGHSDFATEDEVAEFIADRILRYVFGELIECSVLTREGNIEHKADWLLGTDHWEDMAGELVASSGMFQHTNNSWIRWQEWEDIVGECLLQAERSSINISQESFPILTSIEEMHWMSPDNPEDCRFYFRTRASPNSTVRVEWTIYQRGLLPVGTERVRYEVEITEGTPLAAIRRVIWATDDVRDPRIRIWSEAQSPFRWFKAEWRVYHQETRQVMLIREIPGKVLPD